MKKVPYIGKKKLYEMLCSVVDAGSITKLSCCVYKKFRGSEWLEVHGGTCIYSMYHSGYSVSVSVAAIDEEDAIYDVDKIIFSYCPETGQIEENYHRYPALKYK